MCIYIRTFEAISYRSKFCHRKHKIMRDVISVHVGQAGVQLGQAIWELYCVEHGITPEGKLTEKLFDSRQIHTTPYGLKSFYHEIGENHYAPRAVMVDLEPTVIDYIQNTPFKNLYETNCQVKGVEDAANNFACGYYTNGVQLLDATTEAFRHQLEYSDMCHRFMIFHSMGGGTGSGFNARVMEYIAEEHPKKSTLEVAVFPSPTLSTAMTEPYNTLLTTYKTLDTSKCIVSVDNEAIYNVFSSHLDVKDPSFQTTNQILTQAVSSMTSGMRYSSDLTTELCDFETNLVPYPRIHFPTVSIAPIIGSEEKNKGQSSVANITNSCFEKTHRLSNYTEENPKYVSCCLLYRGDVAPKDINEAIAGVKAKRSGLFVNWCQTCIKLGICFERPVNVIGTNEKTAQRTVCFLGNNLGLQKFWTSLLTKFKRMLKKGAFIHWYMDEGMEMKEFESTVDGIQGLIEEYDKVMAQ